MLATNREGRMKSFQTQAFYKLFNTWKGLLKLSFQELMNSLWLFYFDILNFAIVSYIIIRVILLKSIHDTRMDL